VKVTPFEHGLTLATPAEGYVRTPGLHMSDIYGALYKELDPKRYDKRGEDGEPIPMDLLKLELGLSFEQILEDAIARRLLGERPGEFTTPEGVIYSPDQIFFENGELILGEFKLTWYSARNAPFDEKFAKWFTQMKSYCYHLGTEWARLYVLFVNNDYKPPTPKLLAWEIKFTARELQDEWNLMKRMAIKKGLL
jgi:hypothetical protein